MNIYDLCKSLGITNILINDAEVGSYIGDNIQGELVGIIEVNAI